jgi:prepilin-type N-terminal cleavage/methylation domain-containing protein
MMHILYTKRNTKKYQSAFTLIETLLVIAVFTILAFGVNTLVSYMFMNSINRTNSLGNIDTAGIVATNFINEIRDASVGNDGGYPLNQASTTQIIFYTNYGQSAGILAKIRYFISGTTLKKGVTIPTGTPLAYNSAQEKISTVQNGLVSTSTTAIFYYYDGNYSGSTSTPPLTQPVNVTQVKYILMTLTILKKDTNLSTSTFIVNAGASVRSLKTNLGN